MTDQTQYTGWKCWEPSDSELVDFYSTKKVPFEMQENEYLLIKDKESGQINQFYRNNKGKAVEISHASIKIKDGNDMRVNKTITPRNPQQKCAIDMLHNDDITIKLITGAWGTGKTMLLVTAALEAIKEGRFDRIVWIRNNVDVKDTKDLGSLPGTEIEKLLPFLGPFIDHAGGQKRVMKMIDDGQLVVTPLQFLRGRDLHNSIIMCSESENLSKEHLQLIIARAGDGSAVWLDGDVKQRDKTVFEKSQGLETLIKRLTGEKLFGYVRLIKSERSETAALADKLD